MKNEQLPCAHFAPLISEKVDGELDHESAVQLDSHLNECFACQERMAIYQRIDNAVLATGNGDLREMEMVQSPAPVVAPRSSMIGAVTLWTPLAAFASVLIGLMITGLPSPPTTVNAEQIAQPLADLEWIDREHRENHSRMLKMIELDLRALKVEMSQLSVADGNSDDKQRLEQNFDQLVERVSQLGLDTKQ